VDEEMSQKGYYAIGWYHSHPALEAFFSKVDIKNHLFYQKEQTPLLMDWSLIIAILPEAKQRLRWDLKHSGSMIIKKAWIQTIMKLN